MRAILRPPTTFHYNITTRAATSYAQLTIDPFRDHAGFPFAIPEEGLRQPRTRGPGHRTSIHSYNRYTPDNLPLREPSGVALRAGLLTPPRCSIRCGSVDPAPVPDRSWRSKTCGGDASIGGTSEGVEVSQPLLWEVIPMISKAYRATRVNQVDGDRLARGHDGLDLTLGIDVGKHDLWPGVRWADGPFERPWRVKNPVEIPTLVARIQRSMDRGDRSNLRYGQFGARAAARYARGDRVELPDWLCPRSDLRVRRFPSENGPRVDNRTESLDAIQGGPRSGCGKSGPASPKTIQKTATLPPRTGLLPAPTTRFPT
jgi:hypothetical protein